MREEGIRRDLEGTWSKVVDVEDDDGIRISLDFRGTERHLRNWLPDEYYVIDAEEEGDETRATIGVE